MTKKKKKIWTKVKIFTTHALDFSYDSQALIKPSHNRKIPTKKIIQFYNQHNFHHTATQTLTDYLIIVIQKQIHWRQYKLKHRFSKSFPHLKTQSLQESCRALWAIWTAMLK